jgi:hypothetical protein
MPTPVNLNPKITQAGLAIAPSPQNPGFHVEITHVALGTGRFVPNGTETALKAEVARFAVTSGTSPSARVIQVGCTITDSDSSTPARSPNGKGIGEVGFYAGNTLFAVWSQDAEPLFVKSAAFDIPMAYTMDISALADGAVTVTVDPNKAGLEALILSHEAKLDPHAGAYLNNARGDVRYTGIAHAAAADPHANYLNNARGDLRYTPLAHASALDPHSQYLNATRADAGYVKQGGGVGQLTNAVKIGWSGAKVKVTVDTTDQGNIAFESWVNQLFTDLVGAAPQTLNQINELAAALGSDPNFSVTMANSLAGKERKFDAGTRLPFAQWGAPTGWTTVNDDSTNNRMLRVINGNGGGAGGSHDPVYNNVVPSHTHGFTTGGESNDHSHNVYDPGHTHGGGNLVGGLSQYLSGASYIEEGRGAPDSPRTWIETAYTGISLSGINQGHVHYGTTDNGSSQTAWQPRYINMIICQKN